MNKPYSTLIGQWEIKNNPENFLFSIISEFSKNKKNILFQGDSWFEQINTFQKVKDYLVNTQKNINFLLFITNAEFQTYIFDICSLYFLIFYSMDELC